MSDALGTFLVLSGCFLAASAYVLQKKGNMAVAALSPELRRPIFHNITWLCGLVCMILSASLVVASSPFLDQSKSAPLGAATLVFNTGLSSLFLGEKFLILHFLSTVLIIIGAVISSSANASPSADLTYSQIMGLYDSVAAGFSVISVLLFALSFYVLRRISSTPFAEWSKTQKTVLSLLAPALGGCCNGFVSYATKVVTTAAGKGDSSSFSSPFLYLFFLLLCTSVFGQVKFLNLGLVYFPAMAIVPVFQCAIILSNSICGIVYFHDMRSNAVALGVFFLGAFICTLGILLLLLNTADSAESSTPEGRPQDSLIVRAPEQIDTTSVAPIVSLDTLHLARERNSPRYKEWPEPSDFEACPSDVSQSRPWYLREVKSFFSGF